MTSRFGRFNSEKIANWQRISRESKRGKGFPDAHQHVVTMESQGTVDKRQRIVGEILQTEQTYVNRLQLLIEVTRLAGCPYIPAHGRCLMPPEIVVHRATEAATNHLGSRFSSVVQQLADYCKWRAAEWQTNFKVDGLTPPDSVTAWIEQNTIDGLAELRGAREG